MEAKKTTTQEGDQETPLQSTSQGAQGQMANPYGYGFPFGMPYQYPQPSVETIPKLSMAERRQELKKKRATQKRNFTTACNRMRESSRETEEDEEIDEDEIRTNFAKLKTAFRKTEQLTEEIVQLYEGEDPDEDPELHYMDDLEEELRQMRKLNKKIFPEGDPDSTKEEDDEDRKNKDLSRPFEAGVAKENEGIDPEAKVMYQLSGMNFDVHREITPFDGTNVLNYKTFRVSWDCVDRKLRAMGKRPAERLIELKRALTKDALELIVNLPDDDENYIAAIRILDEFYYDNKVYAKTVISKLLDCPRINNSHSSLKETYLTISQASQTLQGLKITKENLGDILMSAICEKKLSNSLYREWLKVIDRKKDPTHPLGSSANLEDMMKIIRDAYKHSSRDEEGKGPEKKTEHNKKEEKQASFQKKNYSSVPGSFNVKEEAKTKKCIFCKAEHNSFSCTKLKSLGGKAAFKMVANAKVCHVCFEKGHTSDKCNRDKVVCRKCAPKYKHHFLIHYDRPNSSTAQSHTSQTLENQSQVNHITADSKGRKVTILQTMMAYAVAPDGSELLVRVFMDAGSEINLIKTSTAEKLGLNGEKVTLKMAVAGGGETTATRETRVNFKLRSLDGKFTSTEMEATTVKTPTTPFQPVSVNTNDYNHIQGIKFTESYPRSGCEVDILIGEPVYSYLISGAPIKGTLHEPVAIPTKLGWMLGGGYIAKDDNPPQVVYTAMRCSLVNANLNETNSDIKLDDFWKLEHLGIKQNQTEEFSMEEQEAVEEMRRCTIYDTGKKQWSTTLLFKDKKKRIPDNFNRARAVARKVESDAIKNGNIEVLNAAYQQLLDNDFAEKVSSKKKPKGDEQVYYLQCHPIFKPENETTKVRIVMNASAKGPDGTSLNSLLHKGPCLLPDFVGILMRFRQKKFVFCMDIAKMFLQIKLHGNKDCLRWLWRFGNQNRDFEIYRMTSVTFGVQSSPYQANYVIQESGKMNKEKLPEAHQIVMKDFYMDNGTAGANSIELTQLQVKELLELMDWAGMPTQKWSASDPTILNDVPQELKRTLDTLMSIFGCLWDLKSDTIIYEFAITLDDNVKTETKRTFLQKIAAIFDPMGLIAPVLTSAKLLFQKLWEDQLDWDDPLPPIINERWKNWKLDAKKLSKLQRERCLVAKEKNIIKQTIVGFGDASEDAYGTSIYLRTEYEDKTLSHELLFSKSRVAPLSMGKDQPRLTIVRLELLGALCTARASRYVAEHLGLPVEACFADSQITLCRIRRGWKPFKQWVGARIKEITELVPSGNWYFVPGVENPADLVSRGCSATELLESELWWHGPKFLNEPKLNWPQVSTAIEDVETTLEKSELRPLLPSVATIKVVDKTTLKKIVNRFEKWNKFIRFTGYMLRLGLPEHKKFRNKNFSIEELEMIELFWWKKSQQMAFSEYEKCLEKECEGQISLKLEKNSPIRDLNPKWDAKRKVILSESRLVLSKNLSEGMKCPIILPRDCDIVKKFVLHLHEQNGHAGANQILSLTNKQFKICKGKQQIRSTIRKCTAKKCSRATNLEQMMAPLPSERIDEPQAFKNVSVDLFGPLMVKHACEHAECPHEKMTKVYGCLFTCFHSRAVHLELLKDQSTDDFLLGFRAFVGRRGCPNYMFSDNGKNFRSAAKELKQLYKTIDWKKVQAEGFKHKIEWCFNIEQSPWSNGVAERMVQSVKRPLRIILGQANLTYRHLAVVFAEVESIVNNRPLSLVSEDTDEMEPITPAELVIGRRMNHVPDPYNRAKEIGSLKPMWIKRQRLLNSFWKRWSKDYLVNLQVRQKWRTPKIEQLDGRIVLIRDDNVSRNVWKMGRIVEQFIGKDGLVRACRLKTPTGYIRRPIQRLALLESIF
jgi:hypothetical protein